MTLDIDDTCDVVHGYQQLSFLNGHYGERCFLPIHVYDTATGRPVAMLLRTGKTPTGKAAAGHIRRLVRQIRRHWPETHITIRGDGHYGRPEVMDWCEANSVDYLLGLTGNAVLRGDTVLAIAADDCAVRRAEKDLPDLRCHAETRHAAKRWKRARRVVARVEQVAKVLLKKNPVALKATKDAIRRVREMTYDNAEDYLIRAQKAANFFDNDGRKAGIHQFIDEKSFKPGLGTYDKSRPLS